tara:strand:- start:282 stop:563 length:282 start_codon:yes stop_codon:yes gene_type:complete
MLHATSVRNCDNTSDKLTVTETSRTETENQSALDFGSPLKTTTLCINNEITVSQFVAIPKDDQSELDEEAALSKQRQNQKKKLRKKAKKAKKT